MNVHSHIRVRGAQEHNLKDLDLEIPRRQITVITGVSGSGKSSLAFDTILAEAQRRFFYTLSHYTRQFLDVATRPKVRQVSGLSPAIALSQNETQASARATVGSLSDVSELLAVLYARKGQQYCPRHNLATEAMEIEDIADKLIGQAQGQTIALLAPIVENKQGHFRQQLEKLSQKGFSRAVIDDQVVELLPVPELALRKKHTIKVVVDTLKVSPQNRARLLRSMQSTFELGEGILEYAGVARGWNFSEDLCGRFSQKSGCPTCGYAWPPLDTRYFSANSLGKCPSCEGYGDLSRRQESDADDEAGSVLDIQDQICRDCQGTGLKKELSGIRILERSVIDLVQMRLDELVPWITLARQAHQSHAAFVRVCEEISGHLSRLVDVGLGYLSLSRRVRSLSGGESQRLRLAGVLGEHLHGILYVLDEPSQGLHPSEISTVIGVLRSLVAQGNTVLIVDHDEQLMRSADCIIDLGPSGGQKGGHVMARFAPQDAANFVGQSLTAKALCTSATTHKASQPSVPSFSDETKWITVDQPSLHHLRMERVHFLRGGLNLVTGVSGAGKSTLAVSTLYENLKSSALNKNQRPSWRYCHKIDGHQGLRKIVLIDRKPIAKSSVSMPISYLGIFTYIRELYAKVPDAQIVGYTARDFSLHAEGGGRCEHCKGKGEITLVMRFLPDARIRCDVCQGQRYRPHILTIEYHGQTVSDVLNMSLQEAADLFAQHPQVTRRLQPAIALGLGYLKMGQPTASLSGGEAQRLKLAPYMASPHGEDSLIVIDEPTTGLHFDDISKLLDSINQLRRAKATVVIIEHSSDLIRAADWIIDLGPEAADRGGRLVFEGRLWDLIRCTQSKTGQAMAHT